MTDTGLVAYTVTYYRETPWEIPTVREMLVLAVDRDHALEQAREMLSKNHQVFNAYRRDI